LREPKSIILAQERVDRGVEGVRVCGDDGDAEEVITFKANE
jgi:hypothetical protein